MPLVHPSSAVLAAALHPKLRSFVPCDASRFAPLGDQFVSLVGDLHPRFFMRIEPSDATVFMNVGQHLRHIGRQPVQFQSPIFFLQNGRDVVQTCPLKSDVTARRRGMRQQHGLKHMQQKHVLTCPFGGLHRLGQRRVVPCPQVAFEPNHMNPARHQWADSSSLQPLCSSSNLCTSTPGWA